MQIRPYRPADTRVLARLHRRARRLPTLLEAGAQAWVALEGDAVAGYASVTPVPGLPHIGEIDGFVATGRRRRGIGSKLLVRVVQAQRGTEIAQLSHAVTSPDNATAQFLRAHGFFLEHEELWLERSLREALPAYALPAGCHLRTFTRTEAIGHFLALYEQSFRSTAWYQPYSSSAEVAAELDRAGDLLFLFCEAEAAGFVWTRLGAGGIAQIEPLGIVPAFRGRGYGGALLRATLHTLARRGAGQVHLGVWRRNHAGLALYQGAGFRHARTRTFLALNL